MISIIAIAFVALLVFAIGVALVIGVFYWPKPIGKVLVIVSCVLLLCETMAVACYVMFRLNVREEATLSVPTLEPAPAPR